MSTLSIIMTALLVVALVGVWSGGRGTQLERLADRIQSTLNSSPGGISEGENLALQGLKYRSAAGRYDGILVLSVLIGLVLIVAAVVEVLR